MKSKSARFWVLLLSLVVVVAGATMMVGKTLPQYVTPYWSLILLFFAIVNIVIYFMTMKMREKNDMGKFTNFYMLVTITKLLVYLAVLLTFILIFPEDKKAFVFTFLAYYLCFTFFETYILTKSKN